MARIDGNTVDIFYTMPKWELFIKHVDITKLGL